MYVLPSEVQTATDFKLKRLNEALSTYSQRKRFAHLT